MIGWSHCICMQNLGSIGPVVAEIYNTKRGLTFDLHLHSQDGLMWTCCYYVIWLADHTAYAYKIWARLDQWLLKYNTKRGLTFDLHLHSQDGLMSTWCYYVIWLADHITYAYKIWARFDQWFLRYKTKGMCVWACVRVYQWLLKYNTKRGLTFDLHLHSQDGLMSTWCYYVIWLADHITYDAYKIWARFDQWFLRYKTKGICVWACVRVCDIQRWEWVKICMCGHTFA